MNRRPPGFNSDRPPPFAPEPSEPHFVRTEHGHGLKRALKIAGAVVGTGVTIVAATAAGVLVHIGLPPARRLAASAVNDILDGSFRGKIEIVRVGRLSASRIDGVTARLIGPDGKRLLYVDGLHARYSLLPLVTSLVSGGDMRVDIRELSIDQLEALLEQAPDGSLTIAQAFQPAKAGPPPSPKKGASGLDLALSRIALKHAWIHGGMSGVPIIDADLDDLAGAFGTTPSQTSADVRHLRLSTRGLPEHADIGAFLEAHLVLPATNVMDGLDGSIAFVGTVGGIDLAVHGSVSGKKLDGVLDVPQVVPSQLDRMLGASPLHQVASAHVEAHGTMTDIDPVVHLQVGKGSIDVGGHVTVPSEGQPDTRAHLTVAARDLDARAMSATGPASSLGLDTTVDARIAPGGVVDGTYDVHVLPGSVGPQPTPEARIAGDVRKTIVHGLARIAEPGAPTEIAFAVDPVAADGPDIAFDARTSARDLARIPRIGASMQGAATVHAAGRLALRSQRVTAHLETRVDRFAQGGQGGTAVDHATMDAVVSGTIAEPVASINLAGDGLHAGGYVFPVFSASVDGTPTEVKLQADMHGGDGPAVRAQGILDTRKGIEAHDVVVSVAKAKDQVTAHIASLRSKGAERLDVEGLEIDGAGQPLTGEAHLRPGSIAARVLAPDLDLTTFARIAGKEQDFKTARLGLDVDLEATRRSAKGHANVDLRKVTYQDTLHSLDATVRATFDGRVLDAHVRARDAQIGEVSLDTQKGELGEGGILDARAWKSATGRAHAAMSVDLERLASSLPNSVPLEKAKGWLTAQLDVTRDDVARRPILAFAASTKGLAFVSKAKTVDNGDGTVTIIGKPLHSRDLDANVKANIDGETGRASFDALLHDKIGTLLQTNAAATLPMTALLGGGDARDALLGMHVKAHAGIPIRSLESMPRVLGRMPVRGQVGFELDVDGTAKDPRFMAVARARDITDTDDPTPVPVSFDTAITYDGENARAQIAAVRPQGKVLEGSGVLKMRARDLLAGSAAWEANADMKFTSFPIGAVTGFVDQNNIDGDLSGTVSLRDLHKAGQLDVALDLAKVDVNGTKLTHVKTTLTARDGSLVAGARLEQKDGYADVKATGAMTWGEEVAPSLDEQKALDVSLDAKNFRASAIAPFVQSAASELDGFINAKTKVHVEPGMKDGTMDGAIYVDKGLFETASVGEELHNLKARVFMKPWGTWNIEEISADGTTGHFTANAFAKMDGFHLRSGEAHLKIAEKEKFPLSMQGVAMGSVWGQIDTKASMTQDGKTLNIDVDVPKLHVELPESSGHAPQSTTPDPTIKAGIRQKDGTMAVLPVDGSLPPPKPPEQKAAEAASTPPLALHIVTHLGKEIEVRRNTMLKMYLAGGPTIDVGKEAKLSGGIYVPSGYIELQGKRFKIEKGSVKFTGQPTDNPVVIATAAYNSPDGTIVYADFVGPVKTGKLTLRSEPQLSQNEILSLLLFGSADGTFGQAAPPGQEGNSTTQAASLAGGVVTQGLNKAISGVSGVEVQTKVDTQESGDPRPEVEVALSQSVSATVIYNLGVPPPGQNPDDTLLQVDYRFKKRYTTEATVGDKGTTILDLTWKYRY